MLAFSIIGRQITEEETTVDQLMLLENPRYRRRRRRRNPGGFLGNPAKALALPSTAREWTQGITVMDGVCGTGGLVGSVLIPAAIIKDADTTGKKVGKLALSIASALGIGAAAKAFVGSNAGKAAVLGGMCGAIVMGIELFTGRSLLGGLKRSTPVRRIAESRAVFPGPEAREIQTSVT